MNKQSLYDFLKKNNFEKYFKYLESHFKSSISIGLQAVDESTISTGNSKMGGRPDLPTNYQYPEITVTEMQRKRLFSFKKPELKTVTKPLSFIAQINLAEIKAYNSEGLLPEHGILYFFHLELKNSIMYDLADKPLFKVLFFDGDTGDLQRTAYPESLDERARYNTCRIVFGKQISLPSVNSNLYDFLDDDERESDRFFDMLDKLETNKLLGYADDIQGEMELCDDDDDEPEKSTTNLSDWILLFQVNSNDKAGMMWLDAGRLYFRIKKCDLLNKRFDRCRCLLQCF